MNECWLLKFIARKLKLAGGTSITTTQERWKYFESEILIICRNIREFVFQLIKPADLPLPMRFTGRLAGCTLSPSYSRRLALNPISAALHSTQSSSRADRPTHREHAVVYRLDPTTFFSLSDSPLWPSRLHRRRCRHLIQSRSEFHSRSSAASSSSARQEFWPVHVSSSLPTALITLLLHSSACLPARHRRRRDATRRPSSATSASTSSHPVILGYETLQGNSCFATIPLRYNFTRRFFFRMRMMAE